MGGAPGRIDLGGRPPRSIRPKSVDPKSVQERVVETVNAGDQVERTGRTPERQGRFHEMQARQVVMRGEEHADEIHAYNLDLFSESIVLDDLGCLNKSFPCATAEVQPGGFPNW